MSPQDKEVDLQKNHTVLQRFYEDFKNEDALTILLDVIDSCRRNV